MSNKEKEYPIIKKELNKIFIPEINDLVMSYHTYSFTINFNNRMALNNSYLFPDFHNLPFSYNNDKKDYNDFKKRINELTKYYAFEVLIRNSYPLLEQPLEKRIENIQNQYKYLSDSNFKINLIEKDIDKVIKDYEEQSEYKNHSLINFKHFNIDDIFFSYDYEIYKIEKKKEYKIMEDKLEKDKIKKDKEYNKFLMYENSILNPDGIKCKY